MITNNFRVMYYKRHGIKEQTYVVVGYMPNGTHFCLCHNLHCNTASSLENTLRDNQRVLLLIFEFCFLFLNCRVIFFD